MWPLAGKIVFKDVEMRYRDNTPTVLNNLSFSVQGGQKIGIVGRTGAGKSSMAMVLTRLVELHSGNIEIDDIDISMINLSTLRDKITVIP